MPNEEKFTFGKTFEQAFREWRAMKEEDAPGTMGDTALVESFVSWLDKTKFLIPQLQVIALMRSRQIDTKLTEKLIEIVGKEKAIEIAKEVHAEFFQKG